MVILLKFRMTDDLLKCNKFLGYDGPLHFSMAEGSPDSVNLNTTSKLPSREDIDLEDQESSPVAEPSEEMLPLDSTQSEGSFGHLVVRNYINLLY